MKKIIIRQNSVLDAVKIVPVFRIMSNEKEQVKGILSKYLYFTRMKSTRKTESESKYIW